VHSLLDWIETTAVARDVAGSAALTAWLSATHALGFTLVIGSALVANLRALGALLPRSPLRDVIAPANRAILIGLTISVATGVLLFSARAVEAAANGTFQLKMLLLIAAAAFQFTILRAVAVRERLPARNRAVAAGAAGLLLWLGLAVTACAFILLE
jgi:hypothetical protein